jgi:MarR family transcriptional regulator, organic hydroperoxide resistance regulator
MCTEDFLYMYTISMYGICMSHVPISGLVWRLSMRWRSAIDRAVAPLGLTHAQYSILAPLLGLDRAGEQPSQRALADATGLEALYVSKLARGLEEAGFLERRRDPADSRALRLVLTPAGRDVADRAVERVQALQAELTAPLSPAQNRALRSALTRLLNPSEGEP